MKFFAPIALIAGTILLASCSSKPTLERSVVEGYTQCITAAEKADGEKKAAEIAKNGYSLFDSSSAEFDCKVSYGIDIDTDLTDYRIIN